jgi:hypothetical protein
MTDEPPPFLHLPLRPSPPQHGREGFSFRMEAERESFSVNYSAMRYPVIPLKNYLVI